MLLLLLPLLLPPPLPLPPLMRRKPLPALLLLLRLKPGLAPSRCLSPLLAMACQLLLPMHLSPMLLWYRRPRPPLEQPLTLLTPVARRGL